MNVKSPGSPVLNIWLKTMEALSATSNVRDYSAGEWMTLFTKCRLDIGSISHDRLELEFTSWVERMRTPQVMVQAIRAYQHSAPYDVQRYFALQPDGSFTTDIIFIEASRP